MDVGYRRHSVAIGLPKGEVLEEFALVDGEFVAEADGPGLSLWALPDEPEFGAH